jgi:hypothetical protein
MFKLTIFLKSASLYFALSLFLINSANAQNQLEDAIKQLSSENVTGYMQPFLNGFSANMNSGFAGSAKIDNKFTIRLDAIGMATIIGAAEKEYSAIAPAPFSQQPVRTATVFGDQGAALQGPEGLSYKFQNGQLDMDYFPLVAPQLTIGNIYNTQLLFRFFTYSSDSDVPDIDMMGIGLRHGLSQYFNNLPVDLATGVFYQTFKIGDIIDTNFFSINGMASKEFSLLTIYGGVQYEYASMNLNYTLSGASVEEDSEIDLSFRSENNIRAILGFNLNLGVVHLRSDFNLGKVSVLSASIGFGI